MKTFLYEIITGDRRGPGARMVHSILIALSLIYVGLVAGVRLLYRVGILRSFRPLVPVISIGNLTTGGVGKTPLVVYVCHHLSAAHKPAVLMRGYMGGGDAVSDEAVMVAEELPQVPVLASPNRVASAKKAVAELSCDCLVLDDGFQHWKLKRDLDIVAVDSSTPFGNGYVLPAGLLREPIRALVRADIIVLTKTDQTPHTEELRKLLAGYNGRALIAETVHRPIALEDINTKIRSSFSGVRGRKIAAVCSIGNPRSFEKTLGSIGVVPARMHAFMDHHVYTTADIRKLKDDCAAHQIDAVLTTQKDAVKLREFRKELGAVAVYSLNIGLTFVRGEREFLERIAHSVHY